MTLWRTLPSSPRQPRKRFLLVLFRKEVLAFLLLSFPARAGPPFITDDPEPVELGHWEIYAFSAGAFGPHDASGLGPSVEVNYGAAPELQLHIISGFAYDDPAGEGVRVGPSDTELGAKYRFVTPGDSDWYPQVGIFPLVELPSGSARRGLGAGYVQAFLPVWLQKNFGKWTVYGGGGVLDQSGAWQPQLRI